VNVVPLKVPVPDLLQLLNALFTLVILPVYVAPWPFALYVIVYAAPVGFAIVFVVL